MWQNSRTCSKNINVIIILMRQPIIYFSDNFNIKYYIAFVSMRFIGIFSPVTVPQEKRRSWSCVEDAPTTIPPGASQRCISARPVLLQERQRLRSVCVVVRQRSLESYTPIARMCAHTGHTKFETGITGFVKLYYLQMILSELCLSNNEKCTDTLDKLIPFEQMKIYMFFF